MEDILRIAHLKIALQRAFLGRAILRVMRVSSTWRKAKTTTLTLTFYSGGEEKQRRKRSKIIGEDFSENCQGY